jgi:hypothetical protein
MSAAPRPSAPDAPRPASETPGDAGHEFADMHKESFRALAASMSFVGVCTLLFGGLSCVFFAGALYLGFVPIAIGTAAGAALCLVTGWWTMSAGRSLSALVGTRGRDVDHLMEAVTEFRRLFGLARIVIVALTLLAVACSGIVVWCILGADRGGKCFGL